MLNHIFGHDLSKTQIVSGILFGDDVGVHVQFKLDVRDNGRKILWMSPFCIFRNNEDADPIFSSVMEVLESPEPHVRGVGHASEQHLGITKRWDGVDWESDLFEQLNDIWEDHSLISWDQIRHDGSSEYCHAQVMDGDYIWQRVVGTDRSMLGKLFRLDAELLIEGRPVIDFSAWYLKRIVTEKGTDPKYSDAGQCQYAFWGFDLLELQI